ncbi:MAG: nickel pincer cofactor biosynthesis protein LarB [Phycisphaerae bacterium]|nr:nickel pincer cofactor biosynthesis protein LarB [Phycisphaerae bacterium]
MNQEALRQILQDVQTGALSPDEAVGKLRHLPFEPMEFANVDHHRSLRCGFPEVIYCEGKTTKQVVKIFERLVASGGNVLATRADPKVYKAVVEAFKKAEYNKRARAITLRQAEPRLSCGTIGIISAGTSDMPVAEEARATCEIMDQRTRTFYDVGVAGIHRLLAHAADIQQMTVIVVVAGMEGALASVIGGLVAAPVIAVPTSVGYGASFQGLAPLLTMLNSCAAGVSVVNIDNGFAAGYMASVINRLADPKSPAEPADTECG